MKLLNKRVTSFYGDTLGRFILGCFVVDENLKQIESAEEYDVVLTIQGVEVDIEAAFNYWVNRQEEQLKYRAVELIKDKTDNIEQLIRETTFEALEGVIQKFNEIKSDTAKKFNMLYDSDEDTFN